MNEPPVLWKPVDGGRMAEFATWVGEAHGVRADGYGELWEWSVTDLPAFWSAIVGYFGVHLHERPTAVLTGEMPGAQWFPGATVNYAEHALTPGLCGRKDDDALALIAVDQSGRTAVTYRELRNDVAAMRAALVEFGVRKGDRVVGLCPNTPAAVVTFLAAASLGAVWSACSPDAGDAAVADRFAPLAPTVLLGAPGFPGPHHVITLDAYDDLLDAHRGAPLEFDPVEFSDPLWVLHSSGSTGPPKGIVHGHGGILLEHLKALALHGDLGDGDRFLWHTGTGWMMWNYLVSGLLVGATVVLHDGSPTYPDIDALWAIAARERVTYLGVSAPYLHLCESEDLRPGEDHDLGALRTVGSTGAPLAPAAFDWIADAVGPSVQTASISGGTDLCTAFLGAAPTVPVWRGEISCRTLGTPAAEYSGELVLTAPMPSMPLYFWDDPDGAKLRAAYFDEFPGVWRHGDWIRFTPRGSCVISGRADATLNRGGIRMGTAEFYAVLESLPEVADALVVDTSGGPDPSEDGEILCFVVFESTALADGSKRIRAALRERLSPRHVPDRIVPVTAIPRTPNGKRREVPVKRLLTGRPVADSRGLEEFVSFAEKLTKEL
ncbi:acetoacetyl-CoA synthetase [Herbihabitans rhizosphaerae]|uniref:Acetoacetyl-CoA synthetase n=1 Tax=Herbihabitans rhizosphaerae TaxID=1872711 RepID=A0A4Q7L5U5_9PSEU|nr:AMP-binding protein [Herbihabitans rhizosphaerae]RZS45028.1 acetoacetyl-CoA synthetase [Herbihabitans rhizosphaerae]